MFVQTMISTLIQLGVVLLIAYVVYWIVARKRTGFMKFIGLVACSWRAILSGAGVGIGFTALLLSIPGLRGLSSSPGSVAGGLVASDASTGWIVAALILAAVVKTALAEEILFRGLIGKRMIAWTGFAVGNTVQALLFGLVHLALLTVPGVDKKLVLLMVVATSVLGWLSGWLNERSGKGSILPGWAAHGTANLIAYLSALVLSTS